MFIFCFSFYSCWSQTWFHHYIRKSKAVWFISVYGMGKKNFCSHIAYLFSLYLQNKIEQWKKSNNSTPHVSHSTFWYKHHRVKINIKMRANCSACKCIAWHRASDGEVETVRVMERIVRRKEKYKIESTVKISRRSKYPNHTQTFNSNTMVSVAI